MFKLNNALSKSESASLTDPSEILTISFKASSDTFPFSLSLTFFINSNNSRDFTLEKSNLVAYPGVAFSTNLPRAGLLTVNKPKMDYSEPNLIDMEGYAFYEAVYKFSCRELLLLLKVVSDGPKSNVKELTSGKISKLISGNIENILSLVVQLEDFSKLEFKRLVPPDICHKIKEKWHFTVSQEHQLSILVRRWTSLFKENALFSEIKNQKSSKSVISYLSKVLDEYEVDWGQS